MKTRRKTARRRHCRGLGELSVVGGCLTSRASLLGQRNSQLFSNVVCDQACGSQEAVDSSSALTVTAHSSGTGGVTAREVGTVTCNNGTSHRGNSPSATVLDAAFNAPRGTCAMMYRTSRTARPVSRPPPLSLAKHRGTTIIIVGVQRGTCGRVSLPGTGC